MPITGSGWLSDLVGFGAQTNPTRGSLAADCGEFCQAAGALAQV